MGELALSVDLEEYFQVSNFTSVVDRHRWDSLPSRVEGPTRRLLDLFDETGSRATFFCLGWVARRRPALLREIAARGHEIASHGYAHELVYEIGPSAFRKDLVEARQAIEDATGQTPVGYRAPSYSITERSLWALDILADEGFRFDSSIFPVRHPRYGIPRFARQPVALDLGDGRTLLEFPLTTLRVGSWKLPVAGGAYLRFMPSPLFRAAWRWLAHGNGAGVLYVHPWEIDPEQPWLRVNLKVRVNHYHNLDRTEGRLRRVLELARFAPVGEVLRKLAETRRLPLRSLDDLLPSQRRGFVGRSRAGVKESVGSAVD